MIGLVQNLNKCRDSYYNQSEPLIPDDEYDTLFDKLTSLDKEAGIAILEEKMPFEMLEPQKGFEVFAIHYGGVPKFKIITIWFDESKTQHQKEQFVDI